MFTQVYFDKTRVAYDHHIAEALRKLLPKGAFPKPEGNGLEKYLKWDDWRVLGQIVMNQAGEHGERLQTRSHYRAVYETHEVPGPADLQQLNAAREKLGDLLAFEGAADKSWYKVEKAEIPVLMDSRKREPLSKLSYPIGSMQPNGQRLLYVEPEKRDEARTKLEVNA